MKIAIMQPYFLPYIGFFQLIHHVDTYVIYDDVQYIKGGFLNRNTYVVNNIKKYINISLSKASPNKMIKEIEVIGVISEVLRKIEYSYIKAPYKNDLQHICVSLSNCCGSDLGSFNGSIIEAISDYFNLDSKILYSRDLHYDRQLKGEDKIIQIVKSLGGQVYLNPIGGSHLYSSKKFRENDIDLKFFSPNMFETESFTVLHDIAHYGYKSVKARLLEGGLIS